MIYLQIRELIQLKRIQWGRKVTIVEIANATGISRITLHRIIRNDGHSTLTDHLDKLCTFFGCEIHELVKFYPDENVEMRK